MIGAKPANLRHLCQHGDGVNGSDCPDSRYGFQYLQGPGLRRIRFHMLQHFGLQGFQLALNVPETACALALEWHTSLLLAVLRCAAVLDQT